MKIHVIELPSGKIAHCMKNYPLTIALVLILTLVPLYYLSPSSYVSFPWNSSSSQKLSSAAMPPSTSPSSFYSSSGDGDSTGVSSLTSSSESGRQCDIFSGEWIPNPEAPYYTNMSCMAIHEHQNCMKYGRPDLGFLKWRWKPDECELPIFNPTQFLETVRGKSMAFVGDSVARNQAQSLICLLSQVMYPVDVSYTRDEDFKRWNYTTYNFTLSTFWTPYLVKIKEADPNNPNLFNLYLDEFDEKWTSQIEEFDYVIISAGHWFYRPIMFYEKGELIGCHYCFKQNITDLDMFYGYRKAFNTAFKAINSLTNYKGLTFLRTFAPSHFENGEWNQGGNCLRTKPYKRNETQLEEKALELYKIQLEEFRIAEIEGKKKGLRYALLDTTQASLLRPDGHPSLYGHKPHENVTLYNDCVHWCLPGPIDTWNDFLLEMLKIIGR